MDLADGIHRAYMFGFRMREDYRSAGIGSSLLEFAEDDLVQRQFKYLCLNVAQTNTRAFELYKRCGYVVLGPDPGIWSYQDDSGEWRQVEEPAWRMEKLLVPETSR